MLMNYGEAIRSGFEYVLENYPEVLVLGQGVSSPWYVGNSMTDLDKQFGKERVIDTPVSEAVCTGAAVGAGLCGFKSIVVHPRMDFMLYAMDPIVNQASKWNYMFGGQASPNVTIRGIINRGGEQGAQHSQALHAWFAHIPGLRVVMPATVKDARDLLIASVLCPDPVLFIDDRWLYDLEDDLGSPEELVLSHEGPARLREGSDITIVGSSYSSKLALDVADLIKQWGVSADVIDLRVVNPFDISIAVESVRKTGVLLVLDGGWKNCGIAGEVMASVCEQLDPKILRATPRRVTLPDAPAPTSRTLEAAYYPNTDLILKVVQDILAEA